MSGGPGEWAEPESVISDWCQLFKHATDFDTWGQPLEATEIYQNLSKQLQQCCSSSSNIFPDDKKKILDKIKVCLDSRAKSLQNRGSKEGISLDDVLKIESTLKNLCNRANGEFPVDYRAAHIQTQQYPSIKPLSVNSFSDEDRPSSRVLGNLLPKPMPILGKSFLTIRIEKLGLKDASQYIDPFVSVSVKDESGCNLTAVQNTPIASHKEDMCVIFQVDVYIQKTVDSLPPGFAIFFEFMHFKPKKKTTSTKCWTFLEKDEIKEGQTSLELYKKPTDPYRKKVHLMTVKPLYLHLKLSLDT